MKKHTFRYYSVLAAIFRLSPLRWILLSFFICMFIICVEGLPCGLARPLMYIYGPKNDIQRLISPVLLNKIPKNLVSIEVVWVLTPQKIWANLKKTTFRWYSVLAATFWFGDLRWILLSIFFGLPSGLARPLIGQISNRNHKI